MSLRDSCFPLETQWSEGERKVLIEMWPEVSQYLSPEVLFVADPEDSIFSMYTGTRKGHVGRNLAERRLVGALREVLQGQHLGFEETKQNLLEILPMRGLDSEEGVSDALIAAFLIAVRMNRETDRELKAFCMAFGENQKSGPLLFPRFLSFHSNFCVDDFSSSSR